jgi:hypothetical protein
MKHRYRTGLLVAHGDGAPCFICLKEAFISHFLHRAFVASRATKLGGWCFVWRGCQQSIQKHARVHVVLTLGLVKVRSSIAQK